MSQRELLSNIIGLLTDAVDQLQNVNNQPDTQSPIQRILAATSALRDTTSGNLASTNARPTSASGSAVVSGTAGAPGNSHHDDGKRKVVTSRQTVIEVKVPKRVVGTVIGRQGVNIQMVQDQTGARINFDNAQRNEDERTCVIRGDHQSAADAERLIRKLVAYGEDIMEVQMYIPKSSVGRIIGNKGDTIRYLSSVSQAKINVNRSSNYEEQVLVTVKGTPEQIDNAKGLISEKVAESEAFEARLKCLASNRQQRGKRNETETEKSHVAYKQSEPTLLKESVSYTTEPLPDVNDYFSVFVSAVSSPGVFWVQLLRTQNLQLDPLVQCMTSHYSAESQSPPLQAVEVGDIVAATFPHDDLWYRARITQVLPDDMIDLYYVDYGDSDLVPQNQLRELRSDFLALPFQAIECHLAGVKPIGGQWTESSIDSFEMLTHVAQWKVINAKVEGYDGDIPRMRLVDTNSLQDVNINEEMVRQGFAVDESETDIKNHKSGTVEDQDNVLS